MFYVPRGLMKRFSCGFLVSITSPGTNLEGLIKGLIFKVVDWFGIFFEDSV